MYTQLPLFEPESSWTPPSFADLPSWADAKRICVDIETKDPQLKQLGPGVRRDGEIVGVAFKIEDGPGFYLPMRHKCGDNMESPEGVIEYLKAQAKIFNGVLVGANLPYDLDYLAEAGVVYNNVKFFRDTQIAEALINDTADRFGLNAACERHGIPGKDEVGLREAAKSYGVDPKTGLWQLPARHVARYGIQDVEAPLKLLRKQERIIDDEDLWKVYDLESRILPVSLKMRRRGVAIDWDKLEYIKDWSIKEEIKLLDEVKRKTGYDIGVGNVWLAQPMAEALKRIGVQPPLTPKTKKPSINKDFLRTIDHPVARLLEQARKVNKLRTTFADSIERHATNGRLHATFNQLKRQKQDGEAGGAAYGRFASSDPNLQQQPSRDEFASMWRSIYIPDGDGIWACCDYSQQEPRLLVHYAYLKKCDMAKEMVKRFCDDLNADNHTMMAQFIAGQGADWIPSKSERTIAKIMLLALCYGQGGAKTARDLGLPTKWIYSKKRGKMVEVAGPEAQAIIDRFNRKVPYVKQMAKLCEAIAKQRGFVRTLSGRRCRFNKDSNGNFDFCYKALNRVIQGGSADQMKMAMLDVEAAGYDIQLQVHDEIDLTVMNEKQAKEVGEIMFNAVKLSVPCKVDVEIGPSWGEIKEVA